MTTFTTLDVIHAHQLYALERLLDPTLPPWGDATLMTHSYWMRKAAATPVGRAA